MCHFNTITSLSIYLLLGLQSSGQRSQMSSFWDLQTEQTLDILERLYLLAGLGFA